MIQLNKNIFSHISIETADLVNQSAASIYMLQNPSINPIEKNGDLLANTGDIDSMPSERRTLTSTKIDVFKAGTSICYNTAFVFAFDESKSGDNLGSLPLYFNMVDSVQKFYNINEGSCFDIYSSKQKVTQDKKQPSVCYNGQSLNFLNCQASKVAVYNAAGQLVYENYTQANPSFSLPFTGNAGIYLVQMHVKNKVVTQKVFIP